MIVAENEIKILWNLITDGFRNLYTKPILYNIT